MLLLRERPAGLLLGLKEGAARPAEAALAGKRGGFCSGRSGEVSGQELPGGQGASLHRLLGRDARGGGQSRPPRWNRVS